MSTVTEQIVEKAQLGEKLQADQAVVQQKWALLKAEQAKLQKETLKIEKISVQKTVEIEKKVFEFS